MNGIHTNKLIANINRTLARANDAERHTGLNWYDEARAQGTELAETFGITIAQACHLIAALSPNNSWPRNLADAWKVCRAWQTGNREVRTCTYSQNRAKGFRILDGDLSALSGQKVCTFAANMLGEVNAVTIDTHALSIAHATRYTVKTCPVISPAMYKQTVKAYQSVARSAGLQPCQVQAITWNTWRRLHGIQSAKELTARLF